MTILRVALDIPLTQLFDYARPEQAPACCVGQRVVVPFGRRALIGVVVEEATASELPREALRAVHTLLDENPTLTPDDLRLLRFASGYYQYPLGQAIAAALPAALRRKDWRDRGGERYVLTRAGSDIAERELPARATVQKRLLNALRERGSLAPNDVRAIGATASVVLRTWLQRGWVERRDRSDSELQSSTDQASARPALTPSQQAALECVEASLGRFATFLLCGVTGSGKTEVYLHAAEAALASGKQVLLLVPEIALTPQLESLVRARFPGVHVVSLHSGLNDTERARGWLAAHRGYARIVLGTRLAVFASLPDLGLVIVDEEHDASFKQTEGFCYSARDLAIVRASQRHVPVVLGSATPSVESYHNARSGRYTLLELPRRINQRPPTIECIRMERGKVIDGFAPAVLEAIEAHLARREQCLVFINRRGFAPVLMCHECGWLSGCHRCSAQLVLHMPERRLRCHHCGHSSRVPHNCPECGNPALTPIGQGTQRIEAALTEHFPAAKVLRIDRDSTRAKHAWRDMRERIENRDVDILVGTQILAKGHDFPHLALVAVVNADSMLYSADYRASERLYALLTQVAGRAGRGSAPGTVLVQTEFPDHALYGALRAQDLHQFMRTLLAQREHAGFPPFVHQALLRAEAARVATALQFLDHARSTGLALDREVELYDPIPAAMVRLAGRERAQLLVQSASRSALHEFLSDWRRRLAPAKSSPVRWTLEVDPLDL